MIIKESFLNYVNTKTSTSHNVHISQIPYIANKITKQTETVTEYEVPDFIKVFAVENGKQVLKTVTHFSIHNNLKMYTVSTGSKRDVVASEDHSLICYDSNSGKLDKFKPADAINMLTPLPLSLNIKKPVSKDEKEGWFIGAIVGDGLIDSLDSGKQKNKNKVMLANSDEGIIKAAQSFLGKEGYSITNTHDFDGHESTSTKTSWSDTFWSGYFREEIGSGAINKHLPRNFLSTTRDYRLGLLAGLLDTDGSIALVKAEAKNKPQYSANYTTISEELQYQIQQLCASLGIRTAVNTYERKNTVYHITIYMTDLVKYKNEINLRSDKKNKLLKEAVVSVDRKDIVPIPFSLAEILQKKIDFKEESVLYAQMSKAKKTGSISRVLAKKVCSMFRLDNDEFKAWREDIVNNDDLAWDVIKSIVISPETIGYDLTVPGPYTFMLSNLLLVQDTMAVHVPIGIDAVNEGFNMTPSKILFKAGKGEVIHGLSQEYLFGLYFLTKIKENTGKHFTSINEAEKAKLKKTDGFYLNGKLTSIGKELVNENLPAEFRVYDAPFDKKLVEKTLNRIAKESPSDFETAINAFKDLGYKYAHERSSTISLSDFTASRDYRDVILKDYTEKAEKTESKEGKINL